MILINLNRGEDCEHEWSAKIPAKHVSHWETFEWKDGRPTNASKGWKEKLIIDTLTLDYIIVNAEPERFDCITLTTT